MSLQILQPTTISSSISAKERLNVDDVLSINRKFAQGLMLANPYNYSPKNGTFKPFESLMYSYKKVNFPLKKWIAENFYGGFPELPNENFIYDIKWFPLCNIDKLENTSVASMIYSDSYETVWQPSLVAIDYINHTLLLWNDLSATWYSFVIPQHPFDNPTLNCPAFVGFLQAWIDW